MASANDPLGDLENSWWVDSDEPWQTLAACMELRNALLCEDPEHYVSHLPIHQVGSKKVNNFNLN
jgi:DNA-directed RNA polymerase